GLQPRPLGHDGEGYSSHSVACPSSLADSAGAEVRLADVGEVLLEHPLEPPGLALVRPRIGPGAAWVQNRARHPGNRYRHVHPEDGVGPGLNVSKTALHHRSADRPRVRYVDPLPGAVPAAGPTRVQHPDLR